MKLIRCLLAGSASLLAVTAAFAADPAAPANSAPAQVAQAGSNQGIEEVTVTAQRRSERLLSVPLAITAATGLQLQTQGLKEITDLQFNTPGLLPENGVGYVQLYIRGIGNGIYVGADPSVAVYIDDVPRIYGSMVNSFVNVDRVEVLKGAQGGLWGRNASGGVVSITTKQPSDDLNGDVRFSYGSKNTGDGAAYLNVPLTDNIDWNISAEREWHDPYIKNVAQPNPLTAANFPAGAYGMSPAQTAAFFNSWVTPEKGYGNQDFYAGDTKLTVHVSEQFKLLFDADFARKHDSEGNQWWTTDPGATLASASGILGLFGIPTNFPTSLWPNTGKFETVSSTASSAALRDYGGSVKAYYDLPGVELLNIFAYRAQQTLYEQNYAAPITLDVPIVRNRKDYIYDEIRATSTSDGPLHWLAGASYLMDFFHGDTVNLLFPPLYTFSFLAASTDTNTLSTDWVHDYSVYGEVSYDLTDHFKVTGSLRYINEKNDAVFSLPVQTSAGLQRDRLLPAGTFSYEFDDGGNAYLRYAEGWKAGGVNPVVPPNLFPTDYGKIFGPEIVSTYEAGYKNSYFDHKVQFTTAIFWNDYSGLQTTTVGNANYPQLIEAIINAGTARTYGWEGNLDWRLIPSVTLGLRSSYLEAEYLTFANSSCAVLSCFNFSNERMIYAPKWENGITIDLDQPLNDRYRLVGNILTTWISNIRGGLSTTPGVGDGIKGYNLTNLRIGIHTSDDKYALSLYVKNLFDKGYETFNASSNFGQQLVWGDPRIVGAEFEVKFD